MPPQNCSKGVVGQFSGTGSGIDFQYIAKILIELAFLYLFSAAFQLAQGMIMTNITVKLTYEFRKQISEKRSTACR